MGNCDTKVFYATKSEVRQAKKRIRKRFHSSVKFYECPYCDGWHLTTSKTNLKKHFKNIDLQHKFRELIQSEQAELVRRISNARTVWKITMGEIGYVVVYNKKTKISKINYYFNVNS